MNRAHSIFYALVALERPGTICDVGSCDGTAAFRFRKLHRGARVIAFEANPTNYAEICADPRSSAIEVRAQAVTDEDGEATFYVLDVPGQEWAKGASSLNHRTAEIYRVTENPITVPACRLDSALADVPGTIAMWVDVEGAASRVVDGFEGIAARIAFICIELEPRALWEGQVEASQVLEKLARLGFREVARNEQWGGGAFGPISQMDVVLTRGVGPVTLMAAKVLAAVARKSQAMRARLGLAPHLGGLGHGQG